MTTFDKLYKSLVVSGALLVSSCASTGDKRKADSPPPNEPAPVTEAAPAESEPKLDCAALCEPKTGPETFCPDPNNGDMSNCCWLMVPELHPCCPPRGGSGS